MKNKLLVSISGPTAVGKTAVSILCGQHFGCEIISCDSRQFYKEIPIGTAQPSADELAQVKHHFIGHLELEETWSAATFEQEAKQLMATKDLGPFNLVVGGSGLYLKALQYGLDEIPEVPKQLREELNAELQNHGIVTLQKKLAELDPDYYREVDIQNPQRIIRALEVCLHTKKPYSSFRKQNSETQFPLLNIALEMDRDLLYERINKRVEKMFALGLEEEARAVFPKRQLNSLNTVGYKELFAHFEGQLSLDEAKELIKQNTRRFAKRQMTWLRRQPNLHWFRASQKHEVLSLIEKRLQ
ncbi:MAG: tRNA (adenosine(37)-N6)-dimethylallyltransferase MiaA [Luteibaculum sp.]